MFNEQEEKERANNEVEFPESEERPKWRRRVREVDFMRVEDTQHEKPLGPFELEMKKKIASAPSPRDLLIEKEEEKEREDQRRLAGERLDSLLRKANLTPNQKACFELLYHEGLSDVEVARKLSVSRERIRLHRRAILKALKRIAQREVEAQKVYLRCKTEKQKLIWRLYYEKGLSAREIARRLGRTKSAVNMVLARIRTKFP